MRALRARQVHQRQLALVHLLRVAVLVAASAHDLENGVRPANEERIYERLTFVNLQTWLVSGGIEV